MILIKFISKIFVKAKTKNPICQGFI